MPRQKPGKLTDGESKFELPWVPINIAISLGASLSQVMWILESLDLKGENNFCERTLRRGIERKYKVKFEEYSSFRMDGLRLSLKQKAIMLGLSGNTAMLIFCLKNLCGWKDRPDDDSEKDKNKDSYYFINELKEALKNDKFRPGDKAENRTENQGSGEVAPEKV